MDFNRLFHEKIFYLSILLALASILIGTAWSSIPPGTVLPSDISFSLLESALQSKAALFALPVAAALPFGDAYLKERQWNYLRFLLIRQSRGTYCQSRILVTAVSGPLVWFFAACLALLFFFLTFFTRKSVSTWPPDCLFSLLAMSARLFLCASFLSSLSAVCAVLGGSAYLAFGLPFLLWYSCIILRERYLESLYYLDPSEWLSPQNDWGTVQAGLWILLVSLALLGAAAHRMVLERKLTES